MSTPSLASNGYAISAEAEETSGRMVVEAAEEAEVTHVVYSSVADCDKENRPKYHISKKKIEDCLKASKLSWTILRPVSFYETWTRFSKVKSGSLTGIVHPDMKQQWVSLHDVGAAAALVLRSYDKYKSRTLDLVADELSGNEMAEKLTQLRKQGKFKYSIAWLMRMLLWIAAHDIYEERVTFPENGGYKANKQDLLELSKGFKEEEFKREGLVNFDRVVMLNGWLKGPLPSSWGVGDYLIYGLGFLGACFASMAYLLPDSIWVEIKKRWAFYGEKMEGPAQVTLVGSTRTRGLPSVPCEPDHLAARHRSRGSTSWLEWSAGSRLADLHRTLCSQSGGSNKGDRGRKIEKTRTRTAGRTCGDECMSKNEFQEMCRSVMGRTRTRTRTGRDEDKVEERDGDGDRNGVGDEEDEDETDHIA
eukprot:767329-Hanusia_phi.AAC.3